MVTLPHRRLHFRGSGFISLEGVSVELAVIETLGAYISLEGLSVELATIGPNLNSSLIGYWRMESGGSADQADDSGNGRTLTQIGGVGTGTGKVGSCRTFDGFNDYLSRASDSGLQLGDTERTWNCWVYLTNKTNTQTIFAKHDGSGPSGSEYQLKYDQPSDRFVFQIFSGSTAYVATANTFGSPSGSTWYMITCKHDPGSDQISIQLNNGAADTASVSGGSNTNSIAFSVGGDSAGAVLLTGRVDELGLWARLLSGAEITALYAAGSGLAFTSFSTQ